MRLSCPNCCVMGSLDNVYILLIRPRFKCGTCGKTSRIQRPVAKFNPRSNPTKIAHHGTFKLQQTDNRLSVSYLWAERISCLTLVVLLTFLFITFYMLLAAWNKPSLLVVAGPLVGWWSYRTICGVFNRTNIDVDRKTINIQHRPFPWPNRHALDIDDIVLFYSGRYLISFKPKVHLYGVNALLKSGRHVRIIGQFSSSDQALYLEQEIETFLRDGVTS